jgi:hypothetical protein
LKDIIDISLKYKGNVFVSVSHSILHESMKVVTTNLTRGLTVDLSIRDGKLYATQSKIILQDNDTIVTKNVDIAEVFSFFFLNVAQDIGKDYTFNKNDHPSLLKIENNNFVNKCFEFKSTNETCVSKFIDKFNAKKATGVDKISVKLMKLGKISLLSPITKIINLSIDSGIFPNRLKEAEVTPLLKKNDNFF